MNTLLDVEGSVITPDWLDLQALDEVVRDLLETAGVLRPPVDVLQVARRLGMGMAADARQQERGRHVRRGGRLTILVRPDRREERLQQTVAQELAELAVPEVAARCAKDCRDLTLAQRQETAQLLASRLLLPSPWFEEKARLVQEDLLRLKRIFATASHELIAWRLLDLPQSSVVSLFDQGRLLCRRDNRSGAPRRVGAVEQWCWRQVQEFGRPCELRHGGCRIQGWPLHEPGWHREVVRLVREVDEEPEATCFARAVGVATAGILAKMGNAD